MIINCSFDEFNQIIYNNLTALNTTEAAIYMRYGYTEKELQSNICEINYCSIYYGGTTDSISWFNDWYEGQNYFEIDAILTVEEIEKLAISKKNEDKGIIL